MQELLTVITELNESAGDAGALIKLFGGRLNSLYGSCAIALVSQSGLPRHQCQVTALLDEHNILLISDDHLDAVACNQPVYTHEQLHNVLKPLNPGFFKGDDTLIKNTFGDLFQRYSTIMTLPLFMPPGVSKWMFLLFTQPTRLDAVDIERIVLIATLATNLGAAVENARRLEEANQWIATEIDSVARIQRQLLPQENPVTPGLTVASRFMPCTQVGGDYYDITELTSFFRDSELSNNGAAGGQSRWGFMIADASGHGSAAAVEIAMFDAILRTYPPNIEAGPAGVFNYANRHIFTRTIRGSFITAFVSAYLPDLGVLSYCNAGHPPPMLKPHSNPQEIVFLEESAGIPLGVSPDGQWQSASVDMQRGDTLVLYTDGLTEAVSPQGELFGVQRLRTIVAQSDNQPQAILNNIETALAAHQQDAGQNDDQTLLIIQASG